MGTFIHRKITEKKEEETFKRPPKAFSLSTKYTLLHYNSKVVLAFNKHHAKGALRKENEGSEGTYHASVSKKKKKKGGVKNYIYIYKVFLFTQHLSSSLCHSSGTKELARQTMLLRQKRKKRRNREEK